MRWKALVLVGVACSLWASACGPSLTPAAGRPATVTPEVVVLTSIPTPLPTATRVPATATSPAPLPTVVPTPVPLPALSIDGPYIVRSDTHQRVWLKGVSVVEFWAEGSHTFQQLYDVRGLRKVVEDKWNVNLLRVALDGDIFDSYAAELDKLVDFAQANGMYCLLTPYASAVDPNRGEGAVPIPDQIVVDFMGKLAARYKDRTNVLYALWNEAHPETPSGGQAKPLDTWQQWIDAAVPVANAVRAAAPQSLLVVPGGMLYSRDLSYYQTHPFPFTNIAYDVHDYYAPSTYSPNYRYSRSMWMWVIGKYPLFVGEFGGACCTVSVPPLQSEFDLSYIRDVLRIVDNNPQLVHYAYWVLDSFDIGATFDRDLALTPRGKVLVDDLTRFPPTRFTSQSTACDPASGRSC